MKIAIVLDGIYPYVKGGSEKRNWEIAKRMVQKGHEIHMFGMKDWNGEKDFIKEGVYIHGVGTHMERYTKRGIRSIKQNLYFAIAVLFPLLKENFDIIDCSSSLDLFVFPTKFSCIFKKTPMVITFHEVWDKYWYDYMGLFKGFIGRLIERVVIKFSDKIISVSDATKDNLITMGVDRDKIKVIPNGISFKDIQNIKPSNRGYDIIFVGRLIKDKNVDLLIKSIKLVKENVPDVTCCIIGDGPEKEKLIKLCENLNLNKNIKFCGFVEKEEEVIKYMKFSKVFAFPSTREGFGIVIIEANACGLPVIAVNSENSKCVKELIKDGENGFVLNELNENILAEKIILLLKDENLRNKMGNNGKNIAEKYDWDKITDEVEKFYTKIKNGWNK